MKKLTVVVAIAWSFVAGLYGDAQAARGCRPVTRRCCVGLTHQPCAPISIRAPRCQQACTTYNGCICAFFEAVRMQGYSMYYAVDFHPDCNTGYWGSLSGNFVTSNPDPCPTCPTNQCIPYSYEASLTPDRKYFKPGTKLDKKLNWDEKLVLNSGTAKIMSANGAERIVQLESKELNDAKLLVSFSQGNSLYFAKLHVCRLESTEANGKSTISDFGIGQEIEPPPADQKLRDVTSQVTVLDNNVAIVRIGSTAFQVVTSTPFSR